MHRIHLKGPWLYEWLDGPHGEADESHCADGKIKMPNSWHHHFGNVTGKVLLRRRFHWIAQLDDGEKVFVVLTAVTGLANVSVNNLALGEVSTTEERARFEITSLLEANNWLEVELECQQPIDDPARSGLWGPVALEVGSPDE